MFSEVKRIGAHSAAVTVPPVIVSGAAAAVVGQVRVFAWRAVMERRDECVSNSESERVAVDLPKHFCGYKVSASQKRAKLELP
jgi:hypothetical protein